ncbi:MAG: hypothetical protein R3F29_06560 [Planctomycetota bacterium]
MNPRTLLAAALFAAFALPAAVVAQDVYYPDATHDVPPMVAFPFYTPGVGATGDSVRVQFLCPDTFLSTQALAEGYVTSIGLSVGGAAAYEQFLLRAGASDATTLGSDWNVNLPDQRVQLDLSGQVLSGGGTPSAPVNEWVDFPLEFPFHYAPGQNLVVDITARLSDASALCYTSTAPGIVQRCYNFQYSDGAPATNFTGSGLKLRFTFAPLGMLPFGGGCSSPSGAAPTLSAVGVPQLGQAVALTVDQLLPNTLGVFVFGFRRSSAPGAPLPLDLGGGCALLVSPDILVADAVSAAGSSGYGIGLPASPSLEGAVLFCQYAAHDALSPATLPFVTSNAGALVVF